MMKPTVYIKLLILLTFLQMGDALTAQSNEPIPALINALEVYTDRLQELRKDPQYRAREEQMNREIRSFNQRLAGGDTLVLPVVFHIVRQNPALITDQEMYDALQDLNDAFSKQGRYAASTGVDTKIRFCLAQKDPDGGITKGITRTESFFADNLNPSIEDEKLKNLVQWDPARYINIWYIETIVEEESARFSCGNWVRSGIGGYATLPPGGGNLDGIVVTRFADMLAHEMGHYLGLYHTFEGACSNRDCTKDGDMVCDTPPDASVGGAPSCSSAVNSCSSDTLSGFSVDTSDFITNFMDYGNSACANQFTAGQADRMRAAIQTQRTGLLELQCSKPCAEDITAAFARDTAYPRAGTIINFTNNSTGASDFQWLVDNSVVSTSQNFSHSFPAAGKYKVTLKAYNNISCFASYTDYVIIDCGVTARFFSDKKTIASKAGIFLDSILFTNTSEGSLFYQWLLSNDVGMAEKVVSTSIDMNYVFTAPANYSVRLIATKGECSDTTNSYTVRVLDPAADGVVNLSGFECYNTTDIRLRINVCNFGIAPIPAGIPITFYDADPRQGTANELSPKLILPQTVLGNCCGVSYTHILNVNKPGLNTVFAVFNDSGNTKPLQLPNTSFAEKEYGNNVRSVSNFQFTVRTIPATAVLEPGDTLILTGQGFPGNVSSYTWSTARDLSCTDCKITRLIADSNITKRLIAVSENGCKDTAFVEIKVPPADDHTIKINSADCARSDSIRIGFTINNSFKRGVIRKGMSVAFYSGNPAKGTATLLQPVFVVPNTINARTATFETNIKGIPEGDLYAVVNDNGTTIPIQLPNQDIYLEKDYSNNIDSISYTPERVVLLPADTTVLRKQTIPVSIKTTVYDPSSITWFPGSGYSVSCTNCSNPAVTVFDSTIVKMEMANKYGCLIKGEMNIRIIAPDMTVRIINTNCFSNKLTLVTFEICMNNNYDSVFARIPVTFYDGNSVVPRKLTPVFYTPTLAAGDCKIYTHVITNPEADVLYAVVNDKGDQPGVIPSIQYDETNYSNNLGSIDFIPFEVRIVPSDTTVPRFNPVSLNTTTIGGTATSYAWSSSQFLSCATCASPIATSPYTVRYQVLVKNEYACTDTASALIKTVSGGLVNIPSAFTPNADGLNDVFYIMGSPDVSMIKDFAVFNRWGEKVFQVNNVLPNDPNFGWNGHLKSAEAPTGAYVYQATIGLADGTQQLFKGTVVLIR